MAFDFNKAGGDTSPKDFVSKTCSKSLIAANPVTYSSKAKFNRKSLGKSNTQKPIYGLPPRIANTKPNGKDSSDSVANGGDRCFTDLPAALVSEILACLDAKELGIVSCVSTLLHTLVSDHQGWKNFYCERWGLPHPPIASNGPLAPGIPLDGKSWKELFIEREFRSKSFMGRFSIDVLRGHNEDVRAVFLLASAKLIFTGGYDSVVRMWDMEEGFLVAESRLLGCTIRAIAADTSLLVAGGTDAFIQCWRSIEGNLHLFDIPGNNSNQNSEFRLWGHEGPVTCLAVDSTRIYSGSWDMSVRVWDRAQMKCLTKLRHGDWVWSLVPRGNTVASTAGRDVYVWDTQVGELITVISSAHVGNAYSLARTHLGDLLFTGGEDGTIHLFEVSEDYNNEDIKPAATWMPHTGPVHSLAFEYPWLVSCSSDGRIALIDVRKLLMPRQHSSSKQAFMTKHPCPGAIEPPQRMLHGFRCNLFAVDIGADRIVCGGEEGVVRVWNFSEALEIEKRVQALRRVRLENRMRRRRAQMEMNGNGSRADQCSVAAKRNQMNRDRSSVWHSKRGPDSKLKA